MLALSLRQPWLWAILHAQKRVENRIWNTSYRGPFYLHASATCTLGDYETAVECMVRHGFVRTDAQGDASLPLVPRREALPLGGIVARATLVDVLLPLTKKANLEEAIKEAREGAVGRRPWHMPGQFGFVLDDVRDEPFRPLRGLQKFFDPNLPGCQPRSGT